MAIPFEFRRESLPADGELVASRCMERGYEDGATEAAAWFQRPKFSRRTKELPNELRLSEIDVRDDGIYSSLAEGSAMNHYA